MSWEAWVTCGVLALVLWGLARNEASPDMLLMGGMTLLCGMRLFSDRFPSPKEFAGAFGNESLVTVGLLFVVAAGLTETGGMALLVRRLLGRPKSAVHAQARMMLPVMGISAFLNNTPVVALFVPVIRSWCKATGISPSKLFIPLSYAAILGGLCTLIGTSTNLVVQGLLLDRSLTPMSLFTLMPIGLPAAAIGASFLVLTSRWLLPDRKDTSGLAGYGDVREYIVEMMVELGSAIDGATVEKAGLRGLPGLYLIEVERDGTSMVAVGPDFILQAEDRLIFTGLVDSVIDLQKIRGLRPATNQVFKLTEPRPNRCLVEVVVSHSCPLNGQSISAGRFRSVYDAAVIAVHRNGERLARKIGNIVLKPGDTLLLETHEGFLNRFRNRRDFYLVSELADTQPVRHNKAWVAVAILMGFVILLTAEFFARVNVLMAASVAAAMMVITRCCSAEQARRSIDWSVLVAIGAAFGIGRAMETTGAAHSVGQAVVTLAQPFGPHGVLIAVYLLTLVMTEMVTNNAAAVLSFPIALAAADALHVRFMPFAIVIAIAASAGFATPLGYQTHLMVYGPGNYRFKDFLRIGIPMDILIMVVTVLLTPIVFRF